MIVFGNKNYNPNAYAAYSIDNSNSSPVTTKVKSGVMDAILAQIRAAVINDDGSVNYYLDPTDFDKKADGTASTLTGADGQIMIYKPKYWYKSETVGDVVTRKFATTPIIGYTLSPAYWIGQQLGSVSGGKLCSVHGVMPTTNYNRAEFRAYAQARGANWCVFPYDVWLFINDAYRYKYNNRNSQADLGDGATNASSGDWSSYNGYNPVVACGLKKALDDVEVAFSVANFVGGTGTLNSQAACFYGIEHIFGHIWQWVDGLNLHNSSVNGARAFICTNPADFADDTETGYTLVGNLAEGDGYITQMIDGGVLPSAVGGGTTTYFSDYHYSYFDNSADSGWRGSRVGGCLDGGLRAGLASSSFRDAASYRAASVGSRLCLYLG